MITLFVVSGQSEVATPDVSISLDKIAHFAVFGALATSICRLPSLARAGWRGALTAWVVAAGFGILDETRQSFTPGRAVEVADAVADALGAAVAVLLYTRFHAYRRLLEGSPSRALQFRHPGKVTGY